MSMTGLIATKLKALEHEVPLVAHLELTWACTWNCAFCYNPENRETEIMPGEAWLHVLDELRLAGCLTIVLTGGEPLLHPDFFAIGREARERGFALRVLTNGSLVTDTAAEAIAAWHPLSVELSLHGSTAATHDRVTRHQGSFELVWRAVERLTERGVRLVLKAPLTCHNQHQIEDMIELAHERDIPFRLDPCLTPRDDGDLAPLTHGPDRAGVERAVRALADEHRLPFVERVAGGACCGVGRSTLAIDPSGEVFPCLQWRTESLGNAREHPLHILWQTSAVRRRVAELAVRVNQRLLELGEPMASSVYCPALAAQITGDPLQPDPETIARATLVARMRSGS
jgi:MoaA/NifB/PqqE/SkfB family radical SAM enzyme